MINDLCIICPSGANLSAINSGRLCQLAKAGLWASDCAGVSSGAVAGAFAATGQHHLTKPIWTKDNLSHRLYGWLAKAKCGYPVDVDYLIDHNCRQFDWEALVGSKANVHVGLFNLATGDTSYFNTRNLAIDEGKEVMKGTCALAGVTRPIKLWGQTWCDGGTAVSLPFTWVKSLGYKRILVLANRPEGHGLNPFPDRYLKRLQGGEFDLVLKTATTRDAIYRAEIAAAKADPAALVIFPPAELAGINPFHRSRTTATKLFEVGERQIQAMWPQIVNWLGIDSPTEQVV